jgi:hypothetical protein
MGNILRIQLNIRVISLKGLQLYGAQLYDADKNAITVLLYNHSGYTAR